MKRFTVTVTTENEAFSPEPTTEVVRILRELADRLESDGTPSDGLMLRDVNGNVVGTAGFGRAVRTVRT